jgi:hypothetical protein
MNIKKVTRMSGGKHVQRTALALAIATGFGLSGQVLAQATTGTIFGTATAGAEVQVTGGAGFSRTVPVGASGHYSVTVPVGTYTVNLLQGGQVVQTHEHVSPQAGSALEADFTGAGASAEGVNAKNFAAVTVQANALPAIDVTSTTQNTTITSEQLARLPVARSAGSIALLAPGTTPGAARLGSGPMGDPLVSFSGSTVVENAYYINGFNTTDPLSDTGGITLPYGSIDQQQTLTSGYGAKYGRSAGGVISQVGKSGTNQWHFGGQVLWQPAFAQANYVNYHYANPRSTTPGQEPGDLYRYRQASSTWNTVYDAYVGGPLIKDKLYVFLSAEANKTSNSNVQPITSGGGQEDFSTTKAPKYYAKLDWNINANNILSLTGIQNSYQTSAPEIYGFDYGTKKLGALQSYGQYSKDTAKIWIAKYTSYITDNLTMSAMVGKMHNSYYVEQPPIAGLTPDVANVLGSGNENPLYGGPGITSLNTSTNISNPRHKSSVTNYRLDLDWRLGDHDLQFGIDNDNDVDINDGKAMTGPGFAWDYGKVDPGKPVTSGVYNVAPPNTQPGGEQGYIVSKYVFVTSATVKVAQRAQYIQDNWQVTHNLLLNLGLRNDQFTNYNPAGVAYLRETSPQWAPRLGFSWDVLGDSSLKVFGNVGRYYIAMPSSVALRAAGAPLYTNQYYTYQGINPETGAPLNIHPLATNAPGGAVPSNNSDGTPIDPKTVAATNLKPEYQDQFVLGMQQQINSSWVYGVTGIVNRMGRAIDDWGDQQVIYNQLIAQGANPATLKVSDLNGGYLINPGATNVIRVANEAGGYDEATITREQMGFQKLKRKYYALDMYLEHPFDGKWYGKVDYTFSRSYGNTEGPVQSSIGQGGSSQSSTEQWDFSQLMEYAGGVQANDQKHQLRAYGYYQLAPEWSVGAQLRIASGYPKFCLGAYGVDEISKFNNYGNTDYHYCGGKPMPPAANGRTPWTHQLDLQVAYRPLWAGKKLGFQVQVFNVFNEQNATQYDYGYGLTSAPESTYMLTAGSELPRYVQFGVTYDW